MDTDWHLANSVLDRVHHQGCTDDGWVYTLYCTLYGC